MKPSWSVPDAVTVSPTVPGVPGAVYDPVHSVDAPGANVVDPHVSEPAAVSLAEIPISVVSPVFVTFAETLMVPLASTFVEADLETDIEG